jgi:anti-sigma factor RsiW
MTHAESHPSLQQLESYLDESLSGLELAVLEDHLADCAECSETLRRMDALLFSGFTAKSHAAAIAAEKFEADPLARALRAARRQYAEYAQALARWLATANALWPASPASPWGEQGVVPVRSQQDAPLEVKLHAGENRATVRVHRKTMTVVVTSPLRAGNLVLLFHQETGEIFSLKPLEPGEQENRAAFMEVPRGEYYLAVAPPELAGSTPVE